MIADERAEAAGFRDASVIVLIEDARRPPPPARSGSARSSSRSTADPDVAEVIGYLRDPESRLRLEGRQLHLPRGQPEADRRQGAPGRRQRIDDELEGEPGVTVGGIALAKEQVNKQVEKDLRTAEMLAFPLLFLLSLLFFRSLVAALLPLMIGGLAIVGTFLLLRVASELGSISIFALNLTTGLGPRAGDRLQPVRRLPLPGGDRQVGARAARR